jgi:hypothetical protein
VLAGRGRLRVERVGEIVKTLEVRLDGKQAALPKEAASSVKLPRNHLYRTLPAWVGPTDRPTNSKRVHSAESQCHQQRLKISPNPSSLHPWSYLRRQAGIFSRKCISPLGAGYRAISSGSS